MRWDPPLEQKPAVTYGVVHVYDLKVHNWAGLCFDAASKGVSER